MHGTSRSLNTSGVATVLAGRMSTCGLSRSARVAGRTTFIAADKRVDTGYQPGVEVVEVCCLDRPVTGADAASLTPWTPGTPPGPRWPGSARMPPDPWQGTVGALRAAGGFGSQTTQRRPC